MSTINHINDENDNQEKKDFFSAPEGFFDSFADNLQKRIAQEELMGITPFLAGMKKTELFNAPAGYFDVLHLKIQDRIKEVPRRMFFGLFTRKQLGLSFSFISAFVIIVFLLPSVQQEEIQLADVPQQEIEEFVQEEMETSSSLEYFPDLNELALNTSFVNAEPEELEDYIMDEIELTEIIDEL